MTMVLCDPSVRKGMSGVAASPIVSCAGQMPLSGASEGETIRLAQRGDAAAFEHLYRSHSRRVYALCL